MVEGNGPQPHLQKRRPAPQAALLQPTFHVGEQLGCLLLPKRPDWLEAAGMPLQVCIVHKVGRVHECVHPLHAKPAGQGLLCRQRIHLWQQHP